MEEIDGDATESKLKILIATDNHLGYGEKKPVIDQDSFRTFEEILQTARVHRVDFVLLGGDLFHEAQPSPYALYKCSELLRKYCFGDDPVSVEYLSDQSANFKHLRNPVVNYEDPNLNICLPIFSIHGNHDSLAGTKQISALDILASQGLINYFGRWTDLSEVEIKPILLKKGKTKLALYGLSHIPDQRLARLFRDHKVTMPRPEGQGWFHLLVLHQNRANRGMKNFIPTSAIPEFIDFVIWGHEHDCRIKPEQEENFYISQPGSSVATSLSEGESFTKQVGILSIKEDLHQFMEIPLKTVRPFLFSTIELVDPDSPEYCYKEPVKQSLATVKQKIDEMISEAEGKHTDPDTEPPLPLIRLNVKYYEEHQLFNAIRIGHEYEDKVANPSEMVKLSRLRPKQRMRTEKFEFGEDIENVDDWATRVEDVIAKYFDNSDTSHKMAVLSVKGMIEGVSRYIDKNDSDAVNLIYDLQKQKMMEKLKVKDPNEDEIDECFKVIQAEREANENKEIDELLMALDSETRNAEATKNNGDGDLIIDSDDGDVEFVPAERPKRGRGSRGGRVSASTSRTPRRRGARAK